MDAQWHGLTVRLLTGYALNVDDVFQAIDRCDFAFATFVGATGDDDFIVFADGN